MEINTYYPELAGICQGGITNALSNGEFSVQSAKILLNSLEEHLKQHKENGDNTTIKLIESLKNHIQKNEQTKH